MRDLADALPKRFAGKTGIGHTRWATHGPATDANAHPHTDEAGRVAVVHNGIIDNAAALRAELADAGVELRQRHRHRGARPPGRAQRRRHARGQGPRRARPVVEGTYGLAVLHADFPDRIVVARNGSPLIIGVGDKEMYVASDLAALVRYTTTVAHLDDGEMATVTAAGFTHVSPQRPRGDRHRPRPRSTSTRRRTTPASTSRSCARRSSSSRPRRGACSAAASTSASAPPTSAASTWTPASCGPIRRVKILGCGSAYYVGQMGAALIEELARIPADAEAASEFRYRNPVIEPDTLYVAVSQSGETIDTLLAVQEIRRKGGRVRRPGQRRRARRSPASATAASTCTPGPRSRSPSTKALTNMFLAFALLALQLGRVRDLSIADGQRLVAGLRAAARADRARSWPARPSWSSSRQASPRRAACSSSAGCAATRSPARARRSSRRSATGTPRRTRPPSSSTARSP